MKNKIILITGASRGIGREIAFTLAKEGHIIVANYNQSEKQAKTLKQEALDQKLQLDIFQADVSKRDEVKKMIVDTIKKYQKIDVLINNAGISSFNLFTDITDNDWNTVINNNLYSAFCVTQEVLPDMIHKKSGCIINISSVWGLVGSSCETLYAISKAGLDAMTKSLAKELGPSNIRVNSIAPGFINTDMNKNLSQETIHSIEQEIPLGKIGSPSSIAKCVNWLVEDDFTTGQIISVNGGWVIT